MQIEEIAQRYARRRDFELVDFSPVALPMYAISLECVCAVHREFPPISLFILRAIKVGLSDTGEIAAFLGLDSSVVQASLGELVQDRYVADSADGTSYAVTELGMKVIEDEAEFVPLEETHTVLFDGILRRPVWLGGERLLRPSELDRTSTIEIRPYPGVLPDLEELRLPDVVSALKAQYGQDEFDRDVLKLSRVTRRSKVFRPAIGLAYKMKRGPEVQIGFLVDEVPHAELERVFAEKGGARKMGFIKALSEIGMERTLRRHLGAEVAQLIPNDAELQIRRMALADARFGLDIASRRAAGDPNPVHTSGLEEARAKYEQAMQAFQMFQARPLSVDEISMLLEDALAGSTTRVIIAVADVWRATVTRELLSLVEEALKRGVEVRVLEFLRRDDNAARRRSENEAIGLARLGHYSNLVVSQSSRRGVYFLVKDRQFAAIANRPFLGPASRTRMFHHFSGYLLQAPHLVEAYVRRLMELHWKDTSILLDPQQHA